MAETQPTADDPVLEQLVAYLDGELTPAESRAVEERLAVDAPYRRQLQQLQQSWDALDALPRTEVDEDFTRTTVEMVALRAADERDELLQAAGRQRLWTWAAIAAGALLAVGLGFALVNSVASKANDRLLHDLPVIEQVDVYRQVESLAFLRQLDRSGLFEEEPAEVELGGAAVGAAPAALAPLAAAARGDEAALRERVAALSAPEKEVLRQKRERFERLPAEEQQRLRSLDAELAAAADRDRLRRVMFRYHDWLQTLASGQRADLLTMAADARLAEMKRIRDDQARERLRRLAMTRLTPEDARVIFTWLGEMIQSHEAELVAAMPEDQQREFAKVTEEMRRRRWLFATLVSNRNAAALDLPTPADVGKLMAMLSEEPRKALQQIGDLNDRRRIVKEWIGAAMMNRYSQPFVSEKELEEFYDKLDVKQKSYMESLAPEQRREELRRQYFISRFRKEHEGKWGPRPGGPGAFRPEGGPFRPEGGGPGGPGSGRRGDRDDRDRGPWPPGGDNAPRSPEGPPPSGFGAPPPPPPDGRTGPPPPPGSAGE